MHIYLALLLFLATSIQASTERIYMSPMEKSFWRLTVDTPLRCEIEHLIPRFGKAVFYQENGRFLQLKVISDHHFEKDLNIAFRSVTANWKGTHSETDLAELKTSGDTDPFLRVTSDAARQAYFELEQGYQPSLFFIDEEDGSSRVSVILSTVRFRDVEAEFGKCLKRLLPHTFDEIKSAKVHFEFDDEFAKEGEEDRALKKMLEYIKLDDSVEKILISGHADFKGSECYNDSLSARRAWYVYDYFILHGVEPQRLQVKYFGESRPLAPGKDDESRAVNRRVSVTMVK